MAEDYKRARGFGKNDNDLYPKMPKAEMKMLKDGTQASSVYDINTDSEKSDLDRMRYHSVGNKGYPRQAFAYDY